MRTLLLSLVLVASPVLAGQTVWVWQERDAKGDIVTHYSDRPVPGARQMELSTSTSKSAPDATVSEPTVSRQSPEPGPLYRRLAVTRPADQENIVNTGGQVSVTVEVEPSIRSGHSLVLLIDGEPAATDNSGQFQLGQVPRGQHTAMAVVTDANGSRLQASAPVTFFVRQESAAQPPVGPSLRPPPKPQPRAGNKLRTTQPTYAVLNPSSSSSPVNPTTNLPATPRPATTKPSTPAPRQGT